MSRDALIPLYETPRPITREILFAEIQYERNEL